MLVCANKVIEASPPSSGQEANGVKDKAAYVEFVGRTPSYYSHLYLAGYIQGFDPLRIAMPDGFRLASGCAQALCINEKIIVAGITNLFSVKNAYK